MSAVSALLASRVVDAGRSRCCSEGHVGDPLCRVDVGQRRVVVGYAAGVEPATARRLFDLGFAPGAVVEVVRRAPLRDPCVYRVADSDIALRRKQARFILVACRPA